MAQEKYKNEARQVQAAALVQRVGLHQVVLTSLTSYHLQHRLRKFYYLILF